MRRKWVPWAALGVVIVGIAVWVGLAQQPAPAADTSGLLGEGQVAASPAGAVLVGTNAFGPNGMATNGQQVAVTCKDDTVEVETTDGDHFTLYDGVEDRITYTRRVSALDVSTRGGNGTAGDVVSTELTSTDPNTPLVQWLRNGTVYVVAGSELSPQWAKNFQRNVYFSPFVWVSLTTRC